MSDYIPLDLNYSNADLEKLAIEMANNNLSFNGALEPDGNIHRYSCGGKQSSKNEWYVIYPMSQGGLLGIFGSWRDSQEFKHTFYSREQDLSGDRIIEIHRKIRDFEGERIKLAQERAAIWTERLKNGQNPKQNHEYLVRKKVKAHRDVRQYGDSLQIPVYDPEGNLTSVQFIQPDGSKRFASGCITKGGRYFFRDPKDCKKIYVAEGYATGASIYEALNGAECVCVAFSASNCVGVALGLAKQFPQHKLVLAQDLGKAGEDTAKEWRRLIGDDVKAPRFLKPGLKDWNDLYVSQGKDEVVKQLTFVPFLPIVNLNTFVTTSREPKRVLVEELFRCGSTNLIYGASGSCKTLLCMDLAFCIALGLPFFGLNTLKSNVLYIDGELPEELIELRLRNMQARFKHPASAQDAFYLLSRDKTVDMFHGRLNLYLEETRYAIEYTVNKAGINVLFLDSLSFLLSRSGTTIKDYQDEEQYWERICDWLYELDKKGVTVFIVHHTLKNSEIMKGSSSIVQFPETIIRLLPHKERITDSVSEEEKQMYGRPVDLEYEKNRNFLGWERLPKCVKLIRDAEAYMAPIIEKNYGWKVDRV